jgi:L-seryl-tRNA(Ser) seleniumtransferase
MVKELYNPFEKYGIRRVINAATSATNLGGSIPDPEVFRAMEDSSKSFVVITELQAWAGKKIAEATGAKAGLPVASACNGLTLGAAACIMKGTELEEYDPLVRGRWSHISMRLPMHTEGLGTEFIVQRECRNAYDYSVECAGGRFVEVDSTKEALDAAYDSERTAGYYFTARGARNGLSIEDVVEVAHANGSYVVVDAAAENPPKMKLRYYIERGADLVSYSGGKHIRGPNNSGLLAGRADLIKLAHLQSYPFSGVGRGSKMSRETIVGLVKALEIYLASDEEAEFQEWLHHVEYFVDELGAIPGVEAGITYQRIVETGEPMAPFCFLKLDEGVCGVSGRELVSRLQGGDPKIHTLWEPRFLLGPDCEGMMALNPEYMLEGEHEVVVKAIKETLGA